MNRQELIDHIAVETDEPKIVVGRVLDSFTRVVMDSVASGREVKMLGFGKFERTKSAARLGRNPATNEVIPVPPIFRPRFTPSLHFKESVRGEPAQETPEVEVA